MTDNVRRNALDLADPQVAQIHALVYIGDCIRELASAMMELADTQRLLDEHGRP